MSEKIGRFEIVSQLAKSSFATVYKALDTENQQTVALKAVRLDQVQDRAALTKRVCDEADSAKSLSSHNIATLYGVGDESDLLLAATEYVQGNSVATTLARHDGFSIWDIQDIARQVCQALDHAHAHNAGHQSLEPAKILVQWDGIVKIIGFGISTMNSLAAAAPTGVPEILYYASPEQARGEACDHRSALFSLGAVLYEMATEQKPFPGETPEQVRQAILEQTPALPIRLKPKVNRALSDLIMKSLAKSPAERYQSGQELVRDLENCKSSSAPAETPKINPAVAPKPKAQAAAAGVGGQAKVASSAAPVNSPATTASPRMSAAPAPAIADAKPAFSVDPMMAGEGDGAAHSSFSDIAEMPPLKDVRVAQPTPSPAAAAEEPEPEPPAAMPGGVYRHVQIEKQKVDLREAAEKAITEIRKVPPKLVLYALIGVAVVIFLIMGMMSLQAYLADREESGNVSVQPAAAPQAAPQKPAAQPAPAPAAQQSATQPTQQPAPQEAAPEAPQPEEPAAPAERGRSRHGRTRAETAPAPAQLTVNSTPAGAEITFDGSALCQTPCTLTGIAPGAHSISASKSGYSATARNISLVAGANATVALDLSQVSSHLSIASTPAGASIVIDGKDTGKLTPMKFSFGASGAHTVTLKRFGYLDATSSVNVQAGQSSTVNLTLTELGETDDIRAAGGKFGKMFKHGEESGMGIVSIKTQPKGAQIMVNQRVLDKTSPFDFYLNPGTYVIDVTMSGYRPIHRVVSIQEGEKVAIQETLSPQ